jgi:predicted aldo/keto reductase-like oxidoreductase
MKSSSSRRTFIAAGLSLPVAGLATPAPPLAPAADRGLTYRTVGKTGLKVTSVGFGCMITSDGSVVSRALDMGITYFDTARGYQQGNNERMVGAALGAGRKNVTLSSKSHGATKAEALKELETSLKELNTDHLDIWYMHNKVKPEELSDELVDAWDTAKRQGKIRFIGVSTHDPIPLVDRILQAKKFDVVLSTFNFTMGATRDAAFKRLTDAGIGLVAMKVMAPASRGQAHPSLKREGGPLAALKWVLKNPYVSTTVPSMTDTDQLDVNFKAMAEKFAPSDEKLLVALNEDIRPYYCRMCFQCSGQCPKGLPVADTIRFLTYADFYGQFSLGREHFLTLPQEVREVRCADCGTCAVRCPNGVHVAERVARAQELFA